MSSVTIECKSCGKLHDIDKGEYNYWIRHGRDYFFCSRKCANQYINNKRKINHSRTLMCPQCGKQFQTSANYEVTYCSRSCASKASVTDYRRLRMSEGGKKSQKLRPATAEVMSRSMKIREMHRYSLIDSFLNDLSIDHEFEFELEGRIFDLAIPAMMYMFEFDGPNHKYRDEYDNDRLKDTIAKSNGWTLVRIRYDDSSIQEFDPSWISKYFE